VTAAIRKLKFESGTGLQPKKGALGMSLQTPRALTAADVTLLRGFVKGKPAGKKVATAKYRKAVAKQTGSKKVAGKLGLENHRKPFAGKLEDLKPFEKKQLQHLVGQEGSTVEQQFNRGGKGNTPGTYTDMEIVDVVAAGKPAFQLYLYNADTGRLYAHGTTKVVADIIQFGFDLYDTKRGKAFVDDFAKAFEEGRKRLKIKPWISFEDDDDEDDDD